MDAAVKFYQDYQSCRFNFPQIPDTLETDEEITNWIFSQNIPYIEIDLDFDIETWHAESKLAKRSLVVHRESQPHSGWKSCCIHGLGVEKTGTDMSAPLDAYHWTELSELTPTIKSFWEQFPFEHLARVRFMQLEAGGYIMPHNDTPPGHENGFDFSKHLVPINIAIDHPSDCFMTLKDQGIVPWATGKIILVNITNDHSVVNFNSESRMHLIAHGLVGNRFKQFCELLVRSYKKQYGRSRI